MTKFSGTMLDGVSRPDGRGTGTAPRTSTLKRLSTIAAAALLTAGVGLASAADIRVKLTGGNEVPAVKTMARGSGVIQVSSNGAVSGKVTTSGIKGTMAHIHEGAAGKEGPPIIALTPAAKGTWVVPQGSKLTPHQYQELLAGELYVNVHSAAHPGGEIRGQLKP